MNPTPERPVLGVSYRGAEITVELLDAPGAVLKINGLVRASETGTPPCVLRLSSTVQTDYEWHEFVEAAVSIDDRAVTVTIDASNSRIAESALPATWEEN